MSENNISQILLRNYHLLTSKTPLFINLPADQYLDDLISEHSDIKVTTFNSNFKDYLGHQQKQQYQAVFGAVYTGCLNNEIKHDLVVIAYPKIKAELLFILAMLQAYVTENAEVILVGEKNGGIQSSPKQLKDHINHYQKYDSARHCSLFCGQIVKSAQVFCLEDWYSYYAINVAGVALKIAALPGVFSQNQLDKGTEVLLANLPAAMSGNILDFGCGAGVIAAFIAKKYPDVQVELADVSALALLSSEKTLAINGLVGNFIATDSLSAINKKYQYVISNPPFHQGISTYYQATESFLQGIKTFINKQGRLIIVANSFLAYENILNVSFKNVDTVVKAKGFTVYSCLQQ